MKIFVRVTDDDGATFEGHADLMQLPKAGATSKNTKIKPAKPRRFTEVTFSLNERAFMKKYTKEMSGSQKFTLLLARLVEGKVGQEISGDRIASVWNRMKNVLGGKYNGAHATRAKEAGWVNSPKWAHYALSSSWKDLMARE